MPAVCSHEEVHHDKGRVKEELEGVVKEVETQESWRSFVTARMMKMDIGKVGEGEWGIKKGG